MMLGGMIKIDLISCTPHPSSITTSPPHIRLTPFTNLPPHLTSTLKSQHILSLPPTHFIQSHSLIEVVTSQSVGPSLQTTLDLKVKSTGNSERNTIEIVFAGLGWVSIGGNFGSAVIKVQSPEGRGVGVRRPVVERIGAGDSLEVVRRRKVGRVVTEIKGTGKEDGEGEYESLVRRGGDVEGNLQENGGKRKVNEMRV